LEAAPGGTPAVHAALYTAVPVSVEEETYALATAAAVSGVGLNSKNPPVWNHCASACSAFSSTCCCALDLVLVLVLAQAAVDVLLLAHALDVQVHRGVSRRVGREGGL